MREATGINPTDNASMFLWHYAYYHQWQSPNTIANSFLSTKGYIVLSVVRHINETAICHLATGYPDVGNNHIIADELYPIYYHTSRYGAFPRCAIFVDNLKQPTAILANIVLVLA
jgi:hypothetical protein